MTVNAGFELWDRKTRNLVLEFDRLDEAVVALRDYVTRNGRDSVDGLSLVAVSDNGEVSMTLSEDEQLLDLVSAAAATGS
jgi:hypothetical protein